MKFTKFLYDKVNVILINLICMFFISLYLYILRLKVNEIFIIVLFWTIILIFYFAVTYFARKRYFTELTNTIENLNEKYLISEIMKKPYKSDDIEFYNIIKKSNKSMIENVSKLKKEQKDYKEYIETWIHDIKIPITSAKLLCENNKNDITRKILLDIDKINNYVEQVLYYARSENVENDYIIKETKLSTIVQNVIFKNKQLLIQNNVSIETDNLDYAVYTDEKWIEFIINQLVINSVKYKSLHAEIKIYAKNMQNSISLIVYDNGIGIKDSEVKRVFDKGFTGTNGRNNIKSTGIGLYLCKKLCVRLGIDIEVQSCFNKYTKVVLKFPIGKFVKVD